MKLADFILSHDGDDLAALALARGRYAGEVPDFDLALTTLEVRRKLRDKVPQWHAVPSLVYPLRISGEQCSSSATARYKASVALTASQQALLTENACCHVSSDAVASTFGPKCLPSGMARGGRRIADLTGGLGVDSWAFAQVFREVLYNEMRPELADAAVHNFRELGVTNIQVRNCALVPSGMASADRPENGRTVSEILGPFRPDILFLDPARRAADGRKVFRLEDCQPDVLRLLPELLSACPRLLLKLSPMADITLVCNQLGCVRGRWRMQGAAPAAGGRLDGSPHPHGGGGRRRDGIGDRGPRTVASRPLPYVASSRLPLGPSLLRGRGWPRVRGPLPPILPTPFRARKGPAESRSLRPAVHFRPAETRSAYASLHR